MEEKFTAEELKLISEATERISELNKYISEKVLPNLSPLAVALLSLAMSSFHDSYIDKAHLLLREDPCFREVKEHFEKAKEARTAAKEEEETSHKPMAGSCKEDEDCYHY